MKNRRGISGADVLLAIWVLSVAVVGAWFFVTQHHERKRCEELGGAYLEYDCYKLERLSGPRDTVVAPNALQREASGDYQNGSV